VAQLCHEIEDRIADAGTFGSEDRVRLHEAWAAIVETHDALTGGAGGDSIRLARKDYEKLLAAVRDIGAPPMMVAEIEAWECEPAVERFALVREQIERLAVRLGKAKEALELLDEICGRAAPPGEHPGFAQARALRNEISRT
jgi:hypothetical protein